jgi:hypothetical protein
VSTNPKQKPSARHEDDPIFKCDADVVCSGGCNIENGNEFDMAGSLGFENS